MTTAFFSLSPSLTAYLVSSLFGLLTREAQNPGDTSFSPTPEVCPPSTSLGRDVARSHSSLGTRHSSPATNFSTGEMRISPFFPQSGSYKFQMPCILNVSRYLQQSNHPDDPQRGRNLGFGKSVRDVFNKGAKVQRL